MAEPETAEDARRLLGRHLAACRRTSGLTQQALASRTGYSRSTVANVEIGRQKVPRPFWQRCDDALGARAGLLRMYDETGVLHPTDAPFETSTTKSADETTQLVDVPWMIDGRRRLMMRSNVDEAKMAYLEAATLDAIAANERQPPATLTPRVRHLRHHVDELLHGHQHPRQRERLYTVALYQSGLLGALSVELARWQTARIYGQEASELATYLENAELQAWARATQSLIEYYAGNYHDALAYARDGQRLDPGGRHSVRLALNGEARALAKLGDHDGVEDAVARGLKHLHELPEVTDIGASLSTGSYHHLRAYANVATAYLGVGQPHRVEAYVKPALAVFDSARLRRPQALSRLDLATALLRSESPTNTGLERACNIAKEALDIDREARLESVAQRAEDFLRSAKAWSNERTVRDTTAHVLMYHSNRPTQETWRAPSPPAPRSHRSPVDQIAEAVPQAGGL